MLSEKRTFKAKSERSKKLLLNINNLEWNNGMTSISVSSFSFYKHLPTSLLKKRRRPPSKTPEPLSTSTLYFSPFDATARNSVRSSCKNNYALPISKSGTYYGQSREAVGSGEDLRRTRRRKSLKRSVKLRPVVREWAGLSKSLKGKNSTTHLCNNIRR